MCGAGSPALLRAGPGWEGHSSQGGLPSSRRTRHPSASQSALPPGLRHAGGPDFGYSVLPLDHLPSQLPAFVLCCICLLLPAPALRTRLCLSEWTVCWMALQLGQPPVTPASWVFLTFCTQTLRGRTQFVGCAQTHFAGLPPG